LNLKLTKCIHYGAGVYKNNALNKNDKNIPPDYMQHSRIADDQKDEVPFFSIKIKSKNLYHDSHTCEMEQ